MDLTFNVIFTPGAVRHLRLAILSLLRYSSYRYRLVSNGLDQAELSLLKRFCGSSDRLEFYPYPTQHRVLPHGILLTLLQYRETGEFFCFMDSDIFASAPFQERLESCLKDCDVFSSCSQLGLDPSNTWVGLQGHCTQTPTGLPLAPTFFSIYRNEPLRRIIAETGVGFEFYSYPEHFREPIRQHMLRAGLEANRCATGKVLNVLCHSYELRFKHEQLEGLSHIGGLSGWFMSPAKPTAMDRVRRFLARRYTLSDDALGLRTGNGSTSGPTDRRKPVGQQRRRAIAGFFAHYLEALRDGGAEPVLAVTDPAIAERISRMCLIIRDLYREHRVALVAQDAGEARALN